MISDEVVKTAEEKYKEELFDRLQAMYQKQGILISEINKLKQYGFNTDLPNVGTTLNNKIVELANIFKEAGTSLYVQKNEEYGVLKLDFLGSSITGQAITNELFNYLMEANTALGKVIECEAQSVKRKEEEALERQKANPIVKFFSRIKSVFVPKLPEPHYTVKEQEQIESLLSKYKGIDRRIFDFNLKDGFVKSIVDYVREKNFSASNIPGLLEESVYPDLEKLGLSDLIPELQEALSEEYKKDIVPGMEVSQENMYLYVPDFDREDDETAETLDTEKLDELMQRVRKSIQENNALIGSDVIKEVRPTHKRKDDKKDSLENTTVTEHSNKPDDELDEDREEI